MCTYHDPITLVVKLRQENLVPDPKTQAIILTLCGFLNPKGHNQVTNDRPLLQTAGDNGVRLLTDFTLYIVYAIAIKLLKIATVTN